MEYIDQFTQRRIESAIVDAFHATGVEVVIDESLDNQFAARVGNMQVRAVHGRDQRLYTIDEVDYYLSHPDEWAAERGC